MGRKEGGKEGLKVGGAGGDSSRLITVTRRRASIQTCQYQW